jgi:hypothetical protein
VMVWPGLLTPTPNVQRRTLNVERRTGWIQAPLKSRQVVTRNYICAVDKRFGRDYFMA